MMSSEAQDSPRLLVIGGSSFLAREFLASNPDFASNVISHKEAHRESPYAGADCVVNFAFAPKLHDSEYESSLDIDQTAAQRALSHGAHYVMISSRRVYSEAEQWDARENLEARGRDSYGRNKARIESNLQALLGDRLTILRPGSVVGFEATPGRQRIAAYMQNQLLNEGCIRLTVAKRTRRDLVPVDFFCRALRQVVLDRIPGVFNVGAGAATSVGEAAGWLIDGFGTGELIEESPRAIDEFQLDSSKLKQAFGMSCHPGELRESLYRYGARLAQHRHSME